MRSRKAHSGWAGGGDFPELPDRRSVDAVAAARERIEGKFSRDGKKRLNIPVAPEFHKQVKLAALNADETIEEWVTTAIEMRLGIK